VHPLYEEQSEQPTSGVGHTEKGPYTKKTEATTFELPNTLNDIGLVRAPWIFTDSEIGGFWESPLK
jgi:hypothetical protein